MYNVNLKSYKDLRSDVDNMDWGYKDLKSYKVMVGFSRQRGLGLQGPEELQDHGGLQPM